MIGQLQQMIDSFQSSTDQLTNNITANVRADVQHQIQMMVGKYVSWISSSITLLAACGWKTVTVTLFCVHTYIELNLLSIIYTNFCPLSLFVYIYIFL